MTDRIFTEQMFGCDMLMRYVDVWMRYVDNVLAVIPKDHNESLLQNLNSQNEHIQFTIERETHRSLPFLDLLINRKDNG